MITDILTSITEQAQQHPDTVAFDYLGKRNTYHELDLWSNRVANFLKSPDNAPIMVYGGQTFDMLVAFIGITKSGRAYIPVDNNSSAERVQAIIQTARPSLIIAVEDLPFEIDCEVITLTYFKEICTEFPSTKSEDKLPLTHNFYVIFTSGTTGTPKGVQITHQNLVSFINWMNTTFDFKQRVTLLQPAFSFDLSVMAIYPTLINGGTLKVLPKSVTDNFVNLFKLLPTLNIENWVSTPSLIDICLMDDNFNDKNYPQLINFLFCGEELSHQTAQNLKNRFPFAHIFNTYGPTESTVAITSIEITPKILERYDRLPIGYVKADTTVKVQNEQDGQPGELIISGPSVSTGYLNAPEQTAASFIQASPNNSYRTGDLGYCEDGLWFFNGRIDFQIKMNGYRIELEEINYYLSKLWIVKHGIVVPKYDKHHKVQQLIGIVVLSANENFSKLIKQRLAKSVMPYMIPQRFIFKDHLPINTNGKVDIKTLINEVNAND